MLCDAFEAHTSSPSSLELIGWRDSDGDGLMDVLDVPFTLEGTGAYDPDSGVYRFVGESSVQTLPNLNPRESALPTESLQNDITINRISRRVPNRRRCLADCRESRHLCCRLGLELCGAVNGESSGDSYD